MQVHVQWAVEAADNTWDALEGHASGQTHTSWARDCQGRIVWSHPLDIHYECLVRTEHELAGGTRGKIPNCIP